MSMNLGYLVSTGIFAAIFFVAVFAQITAKQFHPWLYWTTIIATTTVGTTLADFADRSLGIGYAGGTSLLFALLIASLFVWHRSLGSVSIDTVNSPKAEMLLGNNHVLPDARHRTWRLDRRYSRSWLCWRRNSIQFSAGAYRCGLLLDSDISHHSLLGGLCSHTTAWCSRRRFSRQTSRCWRSGSKPLLSIGSSSHIYRGLHFYLPATCSKAGTLTYGIIPESGHCCG